MDPRKKKEKKSVKIKKKFFGWWGASIDLSSPAGLDMISEWMGSRPDANMTHLSIGGNDWLNLWGPGLAGTQYEAGLLAVIVNRVETIVDHIFSIRPAAQIMWSSYGFVRQLAKGTPAEINRVQIIMAELAAQLALTKPGLSFVDLLRHPVSRTFLTYFCRCGTTPRTPPCGHCTSPAYLGIT